MGNNDTQDLVADYNGEEQEQAVNNTIRRKTYEASQAEICEK